MTLNSSIQIGLYILILLLLAKPLGSYMARIYQDNVPSWLRWMMPLERCIYKWCGVQNADEMDWKRYAGAVLLFNFIGVIFVYELQRMQGFLPLNPQGLGAVLPHSSFNTAISFASNTNWQNYGGENTMSYLTQMLGLGVQNFLSAATGMAVLVALVRGLSRHETNRLGNFWVDLTQSILYILLPLSFVLAIVLVSQGAVQTFRPYAKAQLVQASASAGGKTISQQTIALGPAASQIAIKQLGTNGGGFFNANSAHPFENPTPFSNFLEMLAILLIPAALCCTFGEMVKDARQGWALLIAMTIIFAAFTIPCVMCEQNGSPRLAAMGINESTFLQPGGNMEGKEARFGITDSALWATATTAASNGSVNAMHDSFTPLGGVFPMLLMQLGEVVFGGVGSGLYGMLIFAIVAVFIAGLMVGRTPEYLGKKIEAFEMKMASLVILIPCAVVLITAAIAVAIPTGRAALFNAGAHGFSEVLYAASSAGNNNGSAFAGLGVNTPFYNVLLGFAMLISRYWLIVPTLAIAGSLAKKKQIPSGPGTLPTHGALFIGLLIGVVLIIGALTFIPALALGPIAEHLQMIG